MGPPITSGSRVGKSWADEAGGPDQMRHGAAQEADQDCVTGSFRLGGTQASRAQAAVVLFGARPRLARRPRRHLPTLRRGWHQQTWVAGVGGLLNNLAACSARAVL